MYDVESAQYEQTSAIELTTTSRRSSNYQVATPRQSITGPRQ